MLADEAKRYMREAEVAAATVKRAKKKLGVVSRPRTDDDGARRWWWELPRVRDGSEDDHDVAL